MATSSITEKIRINNPKVIEKFIAATESDTDNPSEKPEYPRAVEITDPAELKKSCLKALRRVRRNESCGIEYP